MDLKARAISLSAQLRQRAPFTSRMELFTWTSCYQWAADSGKIENIPGGLDKSLESYITGITSQIQGIMVI